MIDPQIQSGTARQFGTWHTQNQVLAAALIVCGCPPADPARPCVNIYDLKHPFTPDESNPRVPKYRGEVSFTFEQTELLESLLAAWDEEIAEIAKGKTVSAEESTPEGAMRLTAHAIKEFTAAREANNALTREGLIRLAVGNLYKGYESTAAVVSEELSKMEAAEVRAQSSLAGTGEADIATPDGAARFAAHAMKGYDDVRQWWRFADPQIRILKDGDVHRPEQGREIHPGFIIVSRNARPETLRHLGINPESL